MTHSRLLSSSSGDHQYVAFRLAFLTRGIDASHTRVICAWNHSAFRSASHDVISCDDAAHAVAWAAVMRRSSCILLIAHRGRLGSSSWFPRSRFLLLRSSSSSKLMRMYRWSLSVSVSVSTCHFLTFRAADGEAHLRSIFDSLHQRTQVFSRPSFSSCRSNSAAHSSTTSPLGFVRGYPHRVDFPVKSPITIKSCFMSGDIQSRTMSSVLWREEMGAFGVTYRPTTLISPHLATTNPSPLAISLIAGELVVPARIIAVLPVISPSPLLGGMRHGSATTANPKPCSATICRRRSWAAAEWFRLAWIMRPSLPYLHSLFRAAFLCPLSSFLGLRFFRCCLSLLFLSCSCFTGFFFSGCFPSPLRSSGGWGVARLAPKSVVRRLTCVRIHRTFGRHCAIPGPVAYLPGIVTFVPSVDIQSAVTCGVPHFEAPETRHWAGFYAATHPITTLPLSTSVLAAVAGHCTNATPKPLGDLLLISPTLTSSLLQPPSAAIVSFTSPGWIDSSSPQILTSALLTGREILTSPSSGKTFSTLPRGHLPWRLFLVPGSPRGSRLPLSV